MGIRYYAYPLAPEFVDRATEDPWAFMSDDPLADAWGPKESAPDMLYLDKCWRYLQRLTTPGVACPRIAYDLFEGDVTHTSRGWIPWIKVLTPDAVSEVSRDLSLLDGDDVDALLTRDDFYTTRLEEDRSYIKEHLRSAQAFTARMQARGWGLVYLIG